MPAPMHVASASLNSNSFGSSVAITYPTGSAAGDYVLVILNFNYDNVDLVSVPAGWTRLASLAGANGYSHTVTVLGRKIEADTSVTFSLVASATYTWSVSTLRGVTAASAAAPQREHDDTNLTVSNGVTAGSVPSWAMTCAGGVLDINAGTIAIDSGTTGWTRLANNSHNTSSVGHYSAIHYKALEPGQASGSHLLNYALGIATTKSEMAGAQILLAGSNSAPDVPTSLAPSGATGKNVQTLSAKVSDPDGDTVLAEFQTATDSGFTANLVTHTGSTVASGNTSSTGSITFAANTTYYLRARAKDKYGVYSGYTASQTFITNRPPGAPGAWASPTSGEKVNTTDLVEVAAASDPDGQALTYDFDVSFDNGAAWTAKRTKLAGVSFTYDYTNDPATTTAKWRSRAWDGLVYGAYSTSPTFTVEHNRPPDAATWVSPADNSVLDRAIPQTFDWNFVDPDAGDSQSKYDLRYRLVGATAWTTVSATTTATEHVFAAAALAAGDYETQVLTYDSQGVAASAWSALRYFTMADAPAAPSITAPASGGTVGAPDSEAAWSTPTQTSYQVRRVADNAGSPDVATVYSDTLEVVSSTARNAALSFPVNNRYEHVQVRIKANGLWSSWASVRVMVSYTPPAQPSVTVQATKEALQVVTTHLPPNVLVDDPMTAGTGAALNTGVTLGAADADGWRALAADALPAAGTFTIRYYADLAKLVNGYTYTGSVDVRNTSTAAITVGIDWSDVDQPGASGTNVHTVAAGATVRLATTGARATYDATYRFLDLRVDALSGISVRQAQVEEGTTATAFRLPSTPQPERTDIWRRVKGTVGDGIRRARGASAALWTDLAVVNRVDYEYRAVAVAANGTSTPSPWTG